MSTNPKRLIDLETGFYTIVYPNGEHRTLRVKQPKHGMFEGKKIIGYLSGTDNTKSYTFFGVIDRGILFIWNTWMAKNGHDQLKAQRIRRAVDIVNNDPDTAGNVSI